MASRASPQSPLAERMHLPDKPEPLLALLKNPRAVLRTRSAMEALQWAEVVLDLRSKGPSNESKFIWLYFAFKAQDSRLYTIESMLYTFVSQLSAKLYRDDDIPEGFIELLQTFETDGVSVGWNLDDLFSIFTEILLHLGSNGVCVYWILGNVNPNMNSVGWLLDNLKRLAEECEIKFNVLITTLGPFVGLEAWTLADITEIGHYITETNDAKGKSDFTQDLRIWSKTSEFNLDFWELVQSRPQVYNYITRLQEVLAYCGDDINLRTMFLECCHYHDLDDILGRITADLSSETQIVVQNQIFGLAVSQLSAAPEELVKRTILLTLHPLRPLTLDELEEALSVDGVLPPQCLGQPRALIPILRSSVSGLLDMSDSIIRFQHPNLPGYLLARPLAWMPTPVIAHGEIADLCLKYILANANETKNAMDIDANIHRRHNAPKFLAYSIQEWPRHAVSSANGRGFLSHMSEELLNDTTVVDQWAKEYWGYSNPFVSGLMTRGGPLSIFAMHGLEALLEHTIKQQNSNSGQLAYPIIPVLATSAYYSELSIFERLLPFAQSETESWNTVVLAAMLSGEDQTVVQVIAHAHGRVMDHDLLLCRASVLGQTAAVESLISMIGTLQSDAATLRGMSALELACCRDQANGAIIQTLIDHNKSLVTDEKYISRVVRLATKHAKGEALSILLSISKIFEVARTAQDDLLRIACLFGKHDVLVKLLEMLPSPVSHQFFSFTASFFGTSSHRRCCLALLDHAKDHLSNHTGDYTQILRATLNSEIPDLFTAVLEIPNGLNSSAYEEILYAAVLNNFEEHKFRSLLQAGEQKCGKDETYSSHREAIVLAVEYRNEVALRLLAVENSPSLLEKEDWRKRTPLFRAAWWGHLEMVRILLDAKADIEAADDSGWRPLHAAYDNAGITSLLLDKGAQVSAKTEEGLTALDLAAKWGQSESLTILLGHKPGPDRNSIQSAFSLAIEMGAKSTPKLLIEAGASPLRLPTGGLSQLRQAITNQSVDLVKLLLEFDIDLNDPETDEADPILHTAVYSFSPEYEKDGLCILEALIRRGARVDDENQQNNTPLAQAVLSDIPEVAKCLIENEADVDAETGQGVPIVILACYHASARIVQLLHEQGADFNVVTTGILGSPLHAALYRQLDEKKDAVIQYLVHHVGIDIRTPAPWWGPPLGLACLFGSLDSIELLLEKGAKLEQPDHVGRLPIHFALYRTREHVRLLTSRGARLFVEDKLQRGALHFAVLSGSLELVKYILSEAERQNESIVNAKDIDGWTPLLWAVRVCCLHQWRSENHRSQTSEIIWELRRHGADLKVMGKGLSASRNPLALAAYYRLSEEVINALDPDAKEDDPIDDKRRHRLSRLTRHYRTGKSYDERWFCDMCLT
ncbi:ankyrin repeat-containing protein, partial [Fusarium globosum]